MRLRSSVTIIIATMLTALLVLGGGCVKPAEEVAAEKACIELMQKVPVYYEDFQFWDAKTLRCDPDLSELYELWYERHGDFLENFGISSADLMYLAEAEVLTLARGDFDLQDVRDSLAESYYHDTNYTDMEVWVAKPSEEPTIGGAVALTENLFVWGNRENIDDYLRVVRGEEISLYDNNAAAVMDRLPGVLVAVFSRYPYPEGLIVSVMAYAKEDKGAYRWIWVYKFESPEYVTSAEAEEYFQGIEDEFKEAESTYAERSEPCPIHSFTLEQDGEFMEWSAIIEEEYMIYSLFYG